MTPVQAQPRREPAGGVRRAQRDCCPADVDLAYQRVQNRFVSTAGPVHGDRRVDELRRAERPHLATLGVDQPGDLVLHGRQPVECRGEGEPRGGSMTSVIGCDAELLCSGLSPVRIPLCRRAFPRLQVTR